MMSLLTQPMSPGSGSASGNDAGLSAGVYLSPYSSMLPAPSLSPPSPSSHAYLYSPARKPKERPFRCEEPGCGRRFNRKFTLSEHMKTHTGEKPYVCPVKECSRRFSTSGNLARHKRLHASLKPFECEINGCKRTFPSQEKLDHHIKIHMGRRTHVCRVPGCTKTFSTAGNLTRHTKNRHPELSRSLFPSSRFSRPVHMQRTGVPLGLLQPQSPLQPPYVSATHLAVATSQVPMASSALFPKLEPTSPVLASDPIDEALQGEFSGFQAAPALGENSQAFGDAMEGDLARGSLSLLDDVIRFELTKDV